MTPSAFFDLAARSLISTPSLLCHDLDSLSVDVLLAVLCGITIVGKHVGSCEGGRCDERDGEALDEEL